MRKQLLISTAALLAGIGIASAQEMPGGKQSGGAQMEHGSAAHGSAAQSREQGRGGQAQDLSKQGQSQQRQDKRDQTTVGQAPRDQGKQSQHDQGMSQGKQSQGMPNEGMPGQQGKGKQSQTKQRQIKQSQTKQSQGKQGQAEQRGQGQRDQTTGQGQRDQGQSSAQGQRGERDQTQGPGQQGQAQQGTQGAGGSVTLNSQQRTRIQQTVLAGRNVPRVNNVNFALSVGTAVPSSVRIVDVPSALIEINPQWRGHQYFVVRDEIIIVDRRRKIVATVPVGSSGGAALHSRGGAERSRSELDGGADPPDPNRAERERVQHWPSGRQARPAHDTGADRVPASPRLASQRTTRQPHRRGARRVERERCAGWCSRRRPVFHDRPG